MPIDDSIERLQIYLGATELLQTGAVWLASDGRIIGSNSNFERELGYKKSDLLEKFIFQINPRLNLIEWKRIWKNLQTEGKAELDGDHITADGRLYPIQMSVVLVDVGTQVVCIGIVKNLLSLSRYRDMLELVSKMTKIAAFEWDLIVNELIVTDEMYEILHLDKQKNQITAANFRSYLDQYLGPEDRVQLRETTLKAISEGRPTQLECTGKLANGEQKTVVIHIQPVKNDENTLKVFGAVHDITPQKQAVQPLELTQFALDNAAEMINWLDQSGKIIYANQAMADKLGYTKAEMEQLSVFDIVPSIQEVGWDYIFSSIKAKKQLVIKREKRHRDGSILNMETIANFIEFDGQPIICNYLREDSVAKMDERENKILQNQLQNALDEIALLKNQIEMDNACLQCELAGQFNYHNIITCSDRYKTVLQQVEQVADTAATVLITGETGTGKELIARAIHINSRQGKRPMVKVNCAALPENLIESELFGHEKGSFTGAVARKPGRFELANHSTLFLDEIGEMPLDLQTKLLRVLQEGEFERVGGTETLRTDVRIIAATNRDLTEMVKKGTFRQDLFYRLSVFPIHNMPLRDRPEDIPLLIQHFTKKFADKMGKNIPKIPQKIISTLEKYSFPGNIRELENIIERAVILTADDTLNLDLTPFKKTTNSNDQAAAHEDAQFKTFDEMQRDYIQKALEKTEGRVSGPDGAAVLLGMNDKTLFSKMAKLDIRK